MLKLLLWVEKAKVLKFDDSGRSLSETRKGVFPCLILLGILQGADQADHLAQIGKSGAAIHLALEGLRPIDLAFSLAVTPLFPGDRTAALDAQVTPWDDSSAARSSAA